MARCSAGATDLAWQCITPSATCRCVCVCAHVGEDVRVRPSACVCFSHGDALRNSHSAYQAHATNIRSRLLVPAGRVCALHRDGHVHLFERSAHLHRCGCSWGTCPAAHVPRNHAEKPKGPVAVSLWRGCPGSRWNVCRQRPRLDGVQHGLRCVGVPGQRACSFSGRGCRTRLLSCTWAYFKGMSPLGISS